MEINNFACEFCKKTFSGKSNLTLHQKTAKYCLKIRGSEPSSVFKCEYCAKSFTNNNRLHTHLSICKKVEKDKFKDKEKKEKKEKYLENLEKELNILRNHLEKEKIIKKHLEKQLEEEKERNKTLQETVSKIALNSKGNNTTHIVNNNNNKTYSLNLNDKEAMSKFLDENLDKNVVGGGQKALAQLISNKYLKAPDGKDLYICTDPARQTFEYVNIDGYVEKDIKACKLKRALIDGKVQVKAAEIGPQLWTKEDGSFDEERQNFYILRVTEILNIENDDQKFRGELSQMKS